MSMKLFQTTNEIIWDNCIYSWSWEDLQCHVLFKASCLWRHCGQGNEGEMKVVFWHCIVNCDGGPDESGIAVHVINNDLQGCCIGFLSEDIAYSDCKIKTYEGMHAVVVNMFSQDKFETPRKTHQRSPW